MSSHALIHTKFYVVSKTEQSNGANSVSGWQITLSAVWGGVDKAGHNAVTENHVFGKHTPQGDIKLFITNPIAAARFEVGREYYVDFNAAHPATEVKWPA